MLPLSSIDTAAPCRGEMLTGRAHRWSGLMVDVEPGHPPVSVEVLLGECADRPTT